MFAQSEVKWDDPGFSKIWALLTQIWLRVRFDSDLTLRWPCLKAGVGPWHKCSMFSSPFQVCHFLTILTLGHFFDNFDTLTLFDKFDRQRKDKSPFSGLQRVSSAKNLIEGRAFVQQLRLFRKCKGVQMLMIIVIVVFCNCILSFLTP